MAISTDLKPQHVEAYNEGFDQVPAKWEQAFEFRNDEEASIKIGAWGTEGTNRLPAWPDGASDIPTARVVDIGSKTVNYADFAIQFRVRKRDAQHDRTLIPRLLKMVGRAVANTRALLAAGVVNGAHSTTTVVPGSKTLAATDHPTALGGTRSNKLATACDLGAIFAAMTLARQWVDYDGGDFDFAEGGWTLMYPIVAGLEQTVGQALGSEYTSDQLQKNTSGMFGITAFPWAKITTATHWALSSKVVRSLGFWDHVSAEDNLEVDEDSDSRQTKITCDGAYAAFCMPQPSGFIGAAT